MSRDDLTLQRVRRPPTLRLLQVARVARITPGLVRVTLTGEALRDFKSSSFDDHVKVFFPEPGKTAPALPTFGPNGPVFNEGEPRPVARDYTPRRFNAVSNELDLEFVLHGDGPASTWAAQASPGQCLGIGGPRGSFVVPDAFEWYVLIGDATAIPAIGRRLEELAAAKIARVVIGVADPAERMEFLSDAAVDVQWIVSDDPGSRAVALESALRQLELPAGDGYIWAAAEAATARAVRQHFVEERGVDKTRVRASSYWRHGAAGFHEKLDDGPTR